MTGHPVRLGLRENRAQFALLVAINAFVGAMVGLERSTLPLIGRDDGSLVLGCRRDVAGERLHERVFGFELQRAVVAALEPQGGGGVG